MLIKRIDVRVWSGKSEGIVALISEFKIAESSKIFR